MGGEDILSIVADVNRWSTPMRKPNDLSRSLSVLNRNSTLIAVIENEPVELAHCRHRAWRRAPAVEEARGRRERIAEISASMARGSAEGRTQDRIRIPVAFEAGRDGFWLARWLRARARAPRQMASALSEQCPRHCPCLIATVPAVQLSG